MKLLVSIAAALIIVVIGNTVIVIGQEIMKPPIAKKQPKVLKIHGYEITPRAAKADEEMEQ